MSFQLFSIAGGGEGSAVPVLSSLISFRGAPVEVVSWRALSSGFSLGVKPCRWRQVTLSELVRQDWPASSQGQTVLPSPFSLRGMRTVTTHRPRLSARTWKQVSLSALLMQGWLSGPPSGEAFPVRRDDGVICPGPERRDDDAKWGWIFPPFMWGSS